MELIAPPDFELLTAEKVYSHFAEKSAEVSEAIGDKGEEKVFNLLLSNFELRARFRKLQKKWEKIEGIQVDIYAESQEFFYFIEVKNWSENYYFSPKKNSSLKYEILEQLESWKEKIDENLGKKKTLIILSFLSGEVANNFREFILARKVDWLITVHHDELRGKTWESEYNIQRIDNLIAEVEKGYIKKI